jgi:glutamyl-tRNA synthetase
LEKAKWFNHQYLQKVSDKELANKYFEELKQKNINTDMKTVTKIVSLVKERCSFEKELWQNSDYFFVRPNEYNEKALNKRWKAGTSKIINEIIENISKIDENDWAQKAENFIMSYIRQNELNMGQIMNSIRLAVVGDTKGVDMLQIMKILGKNEIIERLKIAVEKINL